MSNAKIIRIRPLNQERSISNFSAHLLPIKAPMAMAKKLKIIEKRVICKKEIGARAAPNPTIKLSNERAVPK